MSILCTQSEQIIITDRVPRCNCPGDPLGVVRPAISGYVDNLLNPALLPVACTPDVIAPGVIWDGTFTAYIAGYCNWFADPAFDTINIHHRFGGANVFDTGAGFWALQVTGLQGAMTTFVWYGESPGGTGGACTSPVGLRFTAVAPFPIFCGCPPLVTVPAFLDVIAVVP